MKRKAKQVAQQVAQQLPQQVPEQVPQQVPQQVSQQVHQQLPQKVKKTLRVKVTDIWTEPAKLKEDRDNWKREAIALKREAIALRLERDELLERIDQLEKANQEQGALLHEVVPKFVSEVEVVAGQEAVGVGVDDNVGVGVDDNIGVEQNVGVGVDENVGVGVDENVRVGVDQALACSVAFEEFELFLKFKKFLNLERNQHKSKADGHPSSHGHEPADLQTSAQAAQPAEHAQLAHDDKGPSFMTLPNGMVLEVIDVGVF